MKEKRLGRCFATTSTCIISLQHNYHKSFLLEKGVTNCFHLFPQSNACIKSLYWIMLPVPTPAVYYENSINTSQPPFWQFYGYLHVDSFAIFLMTLLIVNISSEVSSVIFKSKFQKDINKALPLIFLHLRHVFWICKDPSFCNNINTMLKAKSQFIFSNSFKTIFLAV